MRKIFALSFLSLLLVCCNTSPGKIQYGSNGGRHITINTKKIYVEEYGKGTPLLLLSGGGLSRSIKDFANVIPELSTKYRVIVPDTPGQGKSERWIV